MGLNLNNHWWLSVVLSILVLVLLWRYAYHSKLGLRDASNSRSLHQGATLTGAGIWMFVPWCLFGLLLAPMFIPFYVVLALSILGFVDDRHDLSFKLRLIFQLVAAIITLYAVGLVIPICLVLFLTFCLLWWVNLFNFMDGANGMAAFHGVISLGFYGLIFADKFNQSTIFSYMAMACILVLCIYLIFNLWLKKLFMGDSGSLPLAWIIAVMALFALNSGLLSFAQVAMVHSVFIVDTTLTLLHRIKKGENITQAHATHLYQRLIKSGRSHSQVSGMYAFLTLMCCLLVWFTFNSLWVVQYSVFAAVYIIFLVVFMKTLWLKD